MSRLRCPSLGLKRAIGRESVGATFQLGGKFGAGRSGGIPKATLISLTSEERRARPHICISHYWQSTVPPCKALARHPGKGHSRSGHEGYWWSGGRVTILEKILRLVVAHGQRSASGAPRDGVVSQASQVGQTKHLRSSLNAATTGSKSFLPKFAIHERAFARGERELPLLKALKGAIIAQNCWNPTYVG
jgi:hypothetical protein